MCHIIRVTAAAFNDDGGITMMKLFPFFRGNDLILMNDEKQQQVLNCGVVQRQILEEERHTVFHWKPKGQYSCV